MPTLRRRDTVNVSPISSNIRPQKKSGTKANGHPEASKHSEYSGIRSGGDDGTSVELSGKIQEFRRNYHDDVDGFQLVNGTLIRFPPHIGQEEAQGTS